LLESGGDAGAVSRLLTASLCDEFQDADARYRWGAGLSGAVYGRPLDVHGATAAGRTEPVGDFSGRGTLGLEAAESTTVVVGGSELIGQVLGRRPAFRQWRGIIRRGNHWLPLLIDPRAFASLCFNPLPRDESKRGDYAVQASCRRHESTHVFGTCAIHRTVPRHSSPGSPRAGIPSLHLPGGRASREHARWPM